MYIDFLLEVFEKHTQAPAMIWKDQAFRYADLLQKIKEASAFLLQKGITRGEVVGLKGDFTPNAIALLLALIENSNIIAPFTYADKVSEERKYDIAQVAHEILINTDTDEYAYTAISRQSDHALYQSLRDLGVPGLVLFTSGTSGVPKGAVHNFTKLLQKFTVQRASLRTINFLMFDHWGGLNTLFHTLSNAGVVLTTRDRRPEAICSFIEKHKIELLPTSPTFLNLLILSEVYKQYDLSSLKLITYGTEPMPVNTLQRAKALFPQVRFQQTYGLIELGVLRSKSKSDDSLWVKLGGEGYDLRVVDNMLQIKADSAMLGYLNAPSPFTEDGYFITGDQVEQDGEYLKILGRKSEIINVGGEKVYPQEVENIILNFENVLDATVYGEKHPIVGNIVCVRITTKEPVEKADFVKALKTYCRQNMQSFKVPVKVQLEDSPLHNDRFKKKRAIN